MNRRLITWLARISHGQPRALAQLDRVNAALGGITGTIAGLALVLLVLRPLAALVFPSFGLAWR